MYNLDSGHESFGEEGEIEMNKPIWIVVKGYTVFDLTQVERLSLLWGSKEDPKYHIYFKSGKQLEVYNKRLNRNDLAKKLVETGSVCYY